jgi:hypothetical protein
MRISGREGQQPAAEGFGEAVSVKERQLLRGG